MSVSYFDKVLGENVRLLHDEQHYLMFDMYAAELKVPLSVVVVDVIGSSVFKEDQKLQILFLFMLCLMMIHWSWALKIMQI